MWGAYFEDEAGRLLVVVRRQHRDDDSEEAEDVPDQDDFRDAVQPFLSPRVHSSSHNRNQIADKHCMPPLNNIVRIRQIRHPKQEIRSDEVIHGPHRDNARDHGPASDPAQASGISRWR